MSSKLQGMGSGTRRAVFALAAFALAACGPELPKTATEAVSGQVSNLATGFSGLEASYRAGLSERWIADTVRSGLQVERTAECDDLSDQQAEVVAQVGKALAMSNNPDAGALDVNWQETAKSLAGAAKGCSLEALPESPRPQKLAAPVSDPGVAKLTAHDVAPGQVDPKVFNAQFILLIDSLSSYYATIAKAASGEDIEAELAQARAVGDAVTKIAGTAGAALGAPVEPLVSAAINLALAIKEGLDKADRYDAIEEALAAVDAETSERIETALGLSAVFLQADTAARALSGSVDIAITGFNATEYEQLALAETRLRAAVAAIERARNAVKPEVNEGLANLAALHQDLLREVQEREGEFQATFERLVTIGKAANELRGAIGDLREGA